MNPGSELLGRERELAELAERFGDGPAGPSALVVVGPAGVGKTALVRAALRRLPDVGIRKAVAQETDRARPYALLEQWGVHLGAAATEQEAVRALVSTWSAAGTGGHSDEPAVRILLVEAAEHAHPAALAAAQSAALLLPHRPRLLLVVRPWAAVDLSDAYRIVLGGLAYADTADLVRAHVPAGNAAVRAAYDLTGGLPGDLLDLVRETPPQTWLEPYPWLPSTARHRQHLQNLRERMSEPAWLLLLAVAVLAEPVELDLAARVARLSAARSDGASPPEHADGLVDMGLLRPVGGRGRTRLSMAHPMTGAAVRDLAGPTVVRQLHRRAADAARHDGDEGARLSHLVEAGSGPDPDLAAALAAHAVRRGAAGAWGQAAGAYIDAARISADDEQRARHLLAAVDAHVGAGELPAAQALVAEIRSETRTPRTDATLGYLSILRGRCADAQSLLTRAWSQAYREADALGRPHGDAEHDPELLALVCTRWVLHSLARGDGRGLVEWADRAIAHAGPGSAYATEAGAIRGLGLGALGRWTEARAGYEEAAARADSTAQTQRVMLGRGWLDLLTDDPVSARSALEAAAPTDFSFGSTRISLWSSAWLARALFVLGHWGRCLEVTRQAAAAVESSGHELIRPLLHWPAAVVHANRGEPDLASAHLHAGAAADHDYLAMRLPSALAHAQVAEAHADYPAALRALEPIAQLLLDVPERDPGFWPWADVYANALVMTGRHADAEHVLTAQLATAAARGQRSATGRAELVLGRLHGARGDVEAALGCFDRAERALAGLPMPVEHARLRYVQGVTLRRAGRRREADEVMRAAREAYSRLGARTYVARCDRELKASGVERTRAAGIGELTPQEATVVELVAGGRTNKEVAGELYVSVKTIQYHLTRIYAKLGVRSRAELAARYATGVHSDAGPRTTEDR